MIASASPGLYALVVLACPIGMALMMWFMGKGMMGRKATDRQATQTQDDGSLASLKADRVRLAQRIAELEQREVERHEEQKDAEVGEPARRLAQ